MTSEHSFLHKLHRLAVKRHCRFGVVIDDVVEDAIEDIGSWSFDVCQHLIEYWPLEQRIFCFGFDGAERCKNFSTHQGQQILGQECHLLIWNLLQPWDANSFSAAIGTLSGGGLLIFVGQPQESPAANQWLNNKLSQLYRVTQTGENGVLPCGKDAEQHEPFFGEQQSAVEAIQRVANGHRKRPLILTAERGRGKTSALGIASAELMQARPISIVVTAPVKRALQPLFLHSLACLPGAVQSKDIVRLGDASLTFMAMDQLLNATEHYDLVLVDEAAAFPVPMLQSLVERYHRIVFSTTINGYEGCGRGFTLTFQRWLKEQRPATRNIHLTPPIRWCAGDPLEEWYRETLLLHHRLPVIASDGAYALRELTAQQIVDTPHLLQDIFTLLVSAHYQTSPNDVFQVLTDDAVRIFVAFMGERVVGCVVGVIEGQLDPSLVTDICLGKRRPRGHLGAITLANQLGISVAAEQTSLRVMRIAVHPDAQCQGIGSQLLAFTDNQVNKHFMSTSFGCTPALLSFWLKNGFTTIKLGSKRDQASGCYSAFMVRVNTVSWLADALNQYRTQLLFELNDTFRLVDTQILMPLVSAALAGHDYIPSRSSCSLVGHYAHGGSNYESVAGNLYQWILARLSQQRPVSALLFTKVVQKHSWTECAKQYGLTGKKQVEQQICLELQTWDYLQCK
ncbi:MAG: GNAT family N-acetyltransferase [Vibrio sp.]